MYRHGRPSIANLTRLIAVWTALLGLIPKVGCISENGVRLPVCATSAIALFCGRHTGAACENCCSCCRNKVKPDSERPICPVSGEPCQTIVSCGDPVPVPETCTTPHFAVELTWTTPLPAKARVVVFEFATVCSDWMASFSGPLSLGQMLRV